MVHERNELDSLFKNRTRTRVEREDDYIDQNMVKQFWSQASCVPAFSFGPWRNQIQVSEAASHITKIHAVHPFRVHVTVVSPSNAESSASSSGGSSDMPWRRHFWAGAMDKSLHRLERWSCGVVETVVACSPSLFPWKWMMLTLDSTMDLDGRWLMYETVLNVHTATHCCEPRALEHDHLVFKNTITDNHTESRTATVRATTNKQTTNKQTNKQANKQTNKQTNKRTNEQTNKQTNKQINKQTTNVLQWEEQ